MGFAPDDFWRQTPRTFAAILDGLQRRRDAEHNGRAWLAYTTAALGRVKKMPKLRDLLARRKPKKRQTGADMLAIARAWTERLTQTSR